MKHRKMNRRERNKLYTQSTRLFNIAHELKAAAENYSGKLGSRLDLHAELIALVASRLRERLPADDELRR